jgi:hypothetical protein
VKSILSGHDRIPGYLLILLRIENKTNFYSHSYEIYYYLSSRKISQILILRGAKTDDNVTKIFLSLNVKDLWLVYCVLNKKNGVRDWRSFECFTLFTVCLGAAL